MAKIEVKFDENRFAGNVYAMVGESTVARLCHCGDTWSVWSAPDAPQSFSSDRNGISKDDIATLEEAKAYAVKYITRRYKRD